MLVSDGENPARTAGLLADFGDQHPGVEVGGSEIVAAAEDANADTQAWVNYVLLGMVILFSAFALLNTLMLGVAGRVRELGLLRLVGGTRRQALRMMRMEAVLMLLIGGALGTAVAMVTVLPFAKAVDRRLPAGHPVATGRRPGGWRGTSRPPGDDAADPGSTADPSGRCDRDQGVGGADQPGQTRAWATMTFSPSKATPGPSYSA